MGDIEEIFSATLALLIHGIVLFPNIENCLDHLAVEIFLTNNPVSFLLADFYHTFHRRREKIGGTFVFYAPLLHFWMRTHMPKRGPFLLALSFGTRENGILRTSFFDVEGSQMSL